LEGRIGFRLAPGGLQRQHVRHQRHGDIAAAIVAEAPGGVWIGRIVVGRIVFRSKGLGHGVGAAWGQARAAACRKASMRAGSFSPAPRSTPEETSTIGAPESRTASTTL